MTQTRPPEQDATRTIWTYDQQCRLDEMVKQREAAMANNRPPVVAVVEEAHTASLCHQGDPSEFLVDWLIKNAALVRGALAPFDLEATRR